MLLTLALWALMAGVAYAAGVGIVSPSTFARAGDRFMAALWVGFVVVSNFWLALALVMPLTFWRTLGITGFSVGLLWLYRYWRTPNWTPLPSINIFAVSWQSGLYGVAGLCGLSLLAAQEVANIDTGGYHYPLVRWLVEYGVVPGIALLQVQYGFISPWHAFVAPFEAGWWQGYIGGAGGFPLALLLLHSIITVERTQRLADHLSDWFVLVAGAVVTSLISLSLVAVGAASLSNDTPVAALITITIWALLVQEAVNFSKTSELAKHPTQTPLLVLMAIGVLTFKLSAAPLAVLVAGWAVYRTRSQLHSVLIIVIISTFLLIPTTIARFVLSGYPFYPSSFTLFQAEWACTAESLRATIVEIRDLPRWYWPSLPTPRYSAGWLDLTWIPYWVKFETLMASYIGLLFISSFALLCERQGRKITAYITSIAWIGVIYIFLFGPLTRYAAGFIVITPSLWLAKLLWNRCFRSVLLVSGLILLITSCAVFYNRPLGKISLLIVIILNIIVWIITALYITFNSSSTWIGIFIIILLSTPMIFITFRLHPQLNIIIPASMPTQPKEIITINGIQVYRPIIRIGVYPLCYGSPLPCAINPDPALTLRNPQRGLSAGFKRQIN